jgi:hypothetical protein
MITAILASFMPVLGRLLLMYVDNFIKDEANKALMKKKIMDMMNKYNNTCLDSANLRNEYEELKKKYLERNNTSTTTK